MAELQVTVKYEYKPARVLFLAMISTLPIWEFAAPVLFGYIIGQVFREPGSIPFTLVITLCPALLCLIVACLALTACAEDNRLYISKDGISLPLFLLPRMRFRRARSWDELVGAEVAHSTAISGDEKSRLFLRFRQGEVTSFDLSCFNDEDLDKLLLALELWGTACTRSPELIEYHNRIQNKSHGQGDNKPGYTQMWEEELSRRFQSTSFIPLEPGNKLQNGRLEVVRQLAFGGLSAIYLAQDSGADLVVLKEAVVPPNAEPEIRADAERHLVREAELLAKLEHPRIARVLDHFIDNGRHYLKLEYIGGQDLRQYVKQNGPVDQITAARWGLQILEALGCLHAQNPPIIHRDLTPENLVLDKDEIKLIDFGAANQFVGSATGTIVGKQAYMPPEQLRGKSAIESDLYAWAGTMHFLLTGKDPVPLSVAHPKADNPLIDDRLDNLIARCSEFEPEDRYHSAEEVAAVLQKTLVALQTPDSTIILVGEPQQ